MSGVTPVTPATSAAAAVAAVCPKGCDPVTRVTLVLSLFMSMNENQVLAPGKTASLYIIRIKDYIYRCNKCNK